MSGRLDVSSLPLVNASLNSLSTCLLVAAFILSSKVVYLHKRAMLTAFATSALFLVTYVIYHWFKEGPWVMWVIIAAFTYPFS